MAIVSYCCTALHCRCLEDPGYVSFTSIRTSRWWFSLPWCISDPPQDHWGKVAFSVFNNNFRRVLETAESKGGICLKSVNCKVQFLEVPNYCILYKLVNEKIILLHQISMDLFCLTLLPLNSQNHVQLK